jgi:hypothetical protein
VSRIRGPIRSTFPNFSDKPALHFKDAHNPSSAKLCATSPNPIAGVIVIKKAVTRLVVIVSEQPFRLRANVNSLCPEKGGQIDFLMIESHDPEWIDIRKFVGSRGKFMVFGFPQTNEAFNALLIIEAEVSSPLRGILIGGKVLLAESGPRKSRHKKKKCYLKPF